MTTHINRRHALAVVAAVTALPAVGLCKGAESEPINDPLLDAIRRYRAELAVYNASRELSDEESDAWCDKCDAILVRGFKHPVCTKRGAQAVIDLVLDEHALLGHSSFYKRLPVLVKAARAYLAGRLA